MFDAIVGDSTCCGVVGDDGGSGLGIAHAVEGGSHDGSFFAINEKGSIFGFGGGRGNVTEDTGGVQDGAVVEVRFIVGVSEIKMASSAAPGFGFIQVAGVAVNLEMHDTGPITYRGFGVCVTVV